MRILVAGYGVVAQAIVSSLIEKHGFQSKDILCFTYKSEENAAFLKFLDASGIRFTLQRLTEEGAVDVARDFAPDFIASLYYRHIIPLRILCLATRMAFNIHPSTLPKFRGCFSGPWAIIQGETDTGVTIHEMVEEVDRGAILWWQPVAIHPDDTGYSLYHRLCAEAITQFDPFFLRLLQGQIVPRPMEPGGAFFGREVPYQGKIDPAWDEARIDRFIRAMFFPPFKGAVLEVSGREVEVNSLEEYHRVSGESAPGLTRPASAQDAHR